MRGIALFEEIRFLDTTLRDGEQTPGVSLTPEDKLTIAQNLDALGVAVIEAGSAIASEGERRSLRAIASAGLQAEICSFARANLPDLDAAIDCGVDSVHLVVPVSDLHIERKLKSNREAVLQRALEVTEYAKSHGLVVELSGEDASRADLDFLCRLYSSGIEAGADRLCFCDTVGLMVPERTFEVFRRLSALGAPVSIHCHNDFGMATSNTVAALRGGAAQAHVTINGIGERAGNTSLEEVTMILENLYGISTGIRCDMLYQVSRMVSRLTGIQVAPNKAIVGENAFTHEAGIHVDALLKDSSTYEAMQPEQVGRERRIVLGKKSGKAAVERALREFGLSVNHDQLCEIVTRVKELGDKGKRVTDADLQAISDIVLAREHEPMVRLQEVTVISGNRVTPTASVKIILNGKETLEAAAGVGPVDAAINAIRRSMVGVADVRLEEYHVDAITGGTNALVEVWVTMAKDDRKITASGAGADIIMASVEAVLEGINRLMWLEERKDG
ncbi:MAG: (R)-citramalate synthase CimA [Methanosaeta sp. PtaB.Bin039]|nr:MAG: (R)-citramalate synthase CimA [Methanosaeta sp. PtaB.Bin039]OPY44957.1 MAG: (R)-citramalate synthase CimA [Methanosaeta sp. PtaU1.Bin028]HOT07398.1 2-isopropylmalate synthase [Methanotrichaceae archaeon]HQF15882.1 2-isopropylmalate synthase [Methanotrichaceae archaeon]HQI90442.1 2-isopropylmalate synthase [Methanotrichaceae archaeon]